MRMIFLGAPGCGKGTQASVLSEKKNIPQISTGDILRKAVADGTELGKKAKTIMESGDLVPDDIILGLIKERLEQKDCDNGYILDGFPRTLVQAESLDDMLGQEKPIDCAVYFEVDEKEIIKRLTSRRTCSQCGKIYNILTDDISEDTACNVCGGKIIQRDDDSEETVKNRLVVYNEKTLPLKAFYEKQGKLKNIDGSQTIENVRADLESLF